jgi:Holliday junction resolvase RusA-like endonuclease
MELTIIMQPRAKARARTVRHGGKVITFTPESTVHAENLIRDAVITRPASSNNFFEAPTPIRLEATFYRTHPISVRREMPTTKPDIDNYYKLCADALEGFLYDNDSQVTTAVIKKRYGYPPRVVINIAEDKASEVF